MLTVDSFKKCEVCCYLFSSNNTFPCDNCDIYYCDRCISTYDYNCIYCDSSVKEDSKSESNIISNVNLNNNNIDEDFDYYNLNSNEEQIIQPNTTYLTDITEFRNLNTNVIVNNESINESVNEVNSVLNQFTLSEKVLTGVNIPLPNLGNTCYINSVLQIFLHSKRLFNELYEILTIGNSNELNVVELISKIRIMYTEEKKYNIYEQHDSYLLLSYLLDKINNLFPSKFNPYYSILLHTKLKCKNKQCKHITHQRQFENILYLTPNGDTKTIEDCMDKDFITSKVEYTCPKCKHNIASKKTIIDNMPEYIFMTLQHFGDNNTDFTIEKSTIQSGIEYELCGMIEHLGPSESSGHYVSYILDQSNKKWYIFDDDRVYRYTSIDEKCNQNNRLYSQILVIWYRIFRIDDDSDVEDTNTTSVEA